MTIYQTIEKVYPELIKMVYKMTNSDETARDLVHDSIADFLSMKKDKQIKIKNDDRIKEYIYRIAKTQYYSSNSNYHTTYREEQILNIESVEEWETLEIEDLQIDDNEQLRAIMSAIGKHCNKFEKQLIADRFVENKTYKEIAKKFDMPTYLLTKQIKTIINKLKNELL